MNSFTVSLEGYDDLIKKIDTYNIQQAVTDELTAFGYDVVRDAKQLAPVDEGFLRNSIHSDSSSLQVTITVNASYAAYIEFGTRKYAAAYVSSLPTEWQTFAAQFKGSGGGTFAEMVQRIMEWVKRKGIAGTPTASGRNSRSSVAIAKQEQAAYMIARSILINGIKAQPFLYPAIEKNRPKLIERIKALFKK